MKSVMGIGNPLLDIIADVTPELLNSYKLGINDFCYEGQDQAGYYEELEKHPSVHYVAGGSTLNSIRVYSSLVGKKDVGFYSGSVGDDENGERIKKLCDDMGVTTMFNVIKDLPTGICGVGILGNNRSLCTRLGGGSIYTVDYLNYRAWSLVENADMMYVAGFMLPICSEGMKAIGEHCANTKKLFITNLSATFLVENFHKAMMEVFYYCDYVIGNTDEWAAFGRINGFETKDLAEIARIAVGLPKSTKTPRVVAVTRAELPTLIVKQDENSMEVEVKSFDVSPVAKSQIVDANAAGDGFVGGFLYGLSEFGGGNLECAIFYAHYAASHIIQRSGCTFDFLDKPPCPAKPPCTAK